MKTRKKTVEFVFVILWWQLCFSFRFLFRVSFLRIQIQQFCRKIVLLFDLLALIMMIHFSWIKCLSFSCHTCFFFYTCILREYLMWPDKGKTSVQSITCDGSSKLMFQHILHTYLITQKIKYNELDWNSIDLCCVMLWVRMKESELLTVQLKTPLKLY